MLGVLFRPKFLLLVLAAIIVFMVMNAVAAPSFNGALSQHAIDRHGADAVKAQECFNNNGYFQVWQRPDTGRIAYLCMISEKDFAVSLQDPADPEPFNYFLQTRTSLFKVIRWLMKSGFTQIQ